MSWSFTGTAKPQRLAAALDAYGDSLEGPPRAEFDDARPHLKALILLNVQHTAHAADPNAMLELTAAGAGVVDPASGRRDHYACNVSIKPVWLRTV